MSAKFEMLVKSLTDTMKNPKKETSPYDTTAVVTRIDGDTAYVHISGGVDETPVSKTVDCKAGDTVQVRVGGGRAWITGNATAPPTDDTTAVKASGTATKFITDMVDGIFVHPENDKKNGVKVTDGVYIIKDGKVVAKYGEITVIGDEKGNHIAIDYDSLDIKEGKYVLASFNTDGMILYKVINGTLTEMARFTSGGYGRPFMFMPIPNDSDSAPYGRGATLDGYALNLKQQSAGADLFTGVYEAEYTSQGIRFNGSPYTTGTILTSSEASSSNIIASGSWSQIDSVILTKGTWVINYGCAFEANATGRRMIVLNSSETSSTPNRQDIKIPAVSGEQTTFNGTRIAKLNSDTVMYLHVYQNSGSSLTVYPYIQAIKIA